MKKALPLMMLACAAFTGCTNYKQESNHIVKETYLHKYGTPVPKSDWQQDGQTVALRDDGVTITTTYSKGELHGTKTFSYPNSSTVRMTETYSHGQLVATRENYPSGVPMHEEIFEDGILVKLNRWYEDGTPQTNEMYQDTFMVTGEYRTPSNVVESRVTDGHGIRFNRSRDGELSSKDTIQNGQMIERITYFPNGDPATVTPYVNNAVHGTRLTFVQGGMPNTVEQWAHGIQEGTTVVYQNGEKIAEVPYVRGRKNGVEYRYRDGEVVMEEVTWKDNLQHGPRRLYVDGQARVEWYNLGQLVTRPTYERMNKPAKAA